MNKKRLSQKRIRYLIKDEYKASSEYRRAGFKGMSQDEKRHAETLKRHLRKYQYKKRRY